MSDDHSLNVIVLQKRIAGLKLALNAVHRDAMAQSVDLVKRLRCPPFGTETSERNLMA